MRDEHGRIRVKITGKNYGDGNPDCLGWAQSAPANDIHEAGGYTVEWDDGWIDHEMTRWYFDAQDAWDVTIEAV